MASAMTHAWSSSDRPARTGLARIIGWSAVNRWGWRVRNHGCAHGSQNDRTPPQQTRRPVVLDMQNITRHRIARGRSRGEKSGAKEGGQLAEDKNKELLTLGERKSVGRE